jgi:sarcosine oxidase subunit gamma
MAETTFHMSVEPCAIIQAEGWPLTQATFEAELSRQLGGSLPAAFGQAVAIGRWQAIRIAPCRFWFVADEASDLRCSIEPELGCLVSLSDSRMRLRLHGPHTSDVLAACVAIDWHAPDARPGQAFQTSLHHVPVLLLRPAGDACDLIVPRSFAQSLAEWIAEVAAPYAHEPAKVTA